MILFILSRDRWRRTPDFLHADSSENGKIQINGGGGRQKRAGRGQWRQTATKQDCGRGFRTKVTDCERPTRGFRRHCGLLAFQNGDGQICRGRERHSPGKNRKGNRPTHEILDYLWCFRHFAPFTSTNLQFTTKLQVNICANTLLVSPGWIYKSIKLVKNGLAGLFRPRHACEANAMGLMWPHKVIIMISTVFID